MVRLAGTALQSVSELWLCTWLVLELVPGITLLIGGLGEFRQPSSPAPLGAL